jgi:hypothetical protein
LVRAVDGIAGERRVSMRVSSLPVSRLMI